LGEFGVSGDVHKNNKIKSNEDFSALVRKSHKDAAIFSLNQVENWRQ
jgi:hypothetical protein